MTVIESKVVEAWKVAAADLGIQFTTPLVFSSPTGESQEYLGIVHQFGGPIGTLVVVLGEPSARVGRPTNEGYFVSILGPGYGRYQRQFFIDTLDDWRFFGADSQRPSWYTGKSWT